MSLTATGQPPLPELSTIRICTVIGAPVLLLKTSAKRAPGDFGSTCMRRVTSSPGCIDVPWRTSSLPSGVIIDRVGRHMLLLTISVNDWQKQESVPFITRPHWSKSHWNPWLSVMVWNGKN